MLRLHPLLASPSIPVTLPLTLCQTPFSPFLLLSLQVWATFPFKFAITRDVFSAFLPHAPPHNPVPELFRTWSSPYVSISRTSERITCSSKEHHVWWFQAPHFPWKWPSWVQDSFLTLSRWKRGEELLYVQCLQGGTIPDVIFKTKFYIFIDIPKPAALAPWGCFCSWAGPLCSFFLPISPRLGGGLQDLICSPTAEGFFSAMWKHLSSLASSWSFFVFSFFSILAILSLLLDKKSDTFWTPPEEAKGWHSPMNTAVLMERNSNSYLIDYNHVYATCVWVCVCVHARAQPCPVLCNFMDCSPPGSSVHGIFQARTLEWVIISSSRVSSQPRNRNPILLLLFTQILKPSFSKIFSWRLGSDGCSFPPWFILFGSW